MGYPDPRWLLRPQEMPWYSIKETDVAYLSRKEDYLVLERLLLLDEEALYQMTLLGLCSTGVHVFRDPPIYTSALFA